MSNMTWIGFGIAVVGLLLAIWGILLGSRLSHGLRRAILIGWLIIPPIYALVEYQVRYNEWFGVKQGDLEHLRHLQSLSSALWLAVAAILSARLFEWSRSEARAPDSEASSGTSQCTSVKVSFWQRAKSIFKRPKK